MSASERDMDSHPTFATASVVVDTVNAVRIIVISMTFTLALAGRVLLGPRGIGR
jgi:hypothetical protein